MTMQEFSRKGGKAGTGAKKRRSAEHYKRLGQLSGEAKRLKKWLREQGRSMDTLTG